MPPSISLRVIVEFVERLSTSTTVTDISPESESVVETLELTGSMPLVKTMTKHRCIF